MATVRHLREYIVFLYKTTSFGLNSILFFHHDVPMFLTPSEPYLRRLKPKEKLCKLRNKTNWEAKSFIDATFF